jgi:hypothetical protein
MAGGLKVDGGAVLAGARIAVIVGGASIALAQAVKSLADTDVNILLWLVLLGGLSAGGMVAGRRQPLSPLTHGALAALAAFVVLIVAVIAIRLALGREVADPISLIFNALMSMSAGLFGGFLAIVRPGPTSEGP